MGCDNSPSPSSSSSPAPRDELEGWGLFDGEDGCVGDSASSSSAEGWGWWEVGVLGSEEAEWKEQVEEAGQFQVTESCRWNKEPDITKNINIKFACMDQ